MSAASRPAWRYDGVWLRVWAMDRRSRRAARTFSARRRNVRVTPETSALWTNVGRRQRGRR